MAYSINFDQRGKYLYARIVGKNTRKVILSYIQDIISKCIEIDCPNVLIHECLEGPRLDPIELFETISGTGKLVSGQFDIIAYVDEKMGDLMAFGESLAVNRGMPLTAFSDLEGATTWITAQVAD